ncbi:MAG: hypothetical protein ACI8P3_002657 [Saprospiraceae bacterium]|jgi:hypothetical protein
MRSLPLILLLNLFFFACQSGDTTENSTTTSTETTEAVKDAPVTKYKLTPFTTSPAYDDAEITQMLYLNDKWDFQIGGSSYKLGEQTSDAPQKMCANSGKGQHLHLIINNEPYIAKYTAAFDDPLLAPGEYHMLAFLSRSYHESIKTKAAHKAQKITVENNMIKRAESINYPMVFYSRPKGTYTGKKETEKVMLDFYVVEAMLGANKYKVKVNINGEEDHLLDTWQPYYIEGLPMGTNTVTLTLLDPKGEVVEAPYNPISREFELKADALE